MAYRWLRPLLFALPPETAHALALAALKARGVWPAQARQYGKPVTRNGLRFANRVGVAAGLDKNAVAAAGLARLGFGFVETGTVTPRPQRGNPKPRLFRLQEDEALVNRMGFNGAGVDAVAANLRRLQGRLGVPLGVNIGMNRDTPLDEAMRDYETCLSALHGLADYIAVNLSSPNTPGLRALQEPAAARSLVSRLATLRRRLASEKDDVAKAVFVKISPDLPPEGFAATAAAVLEGGADGLIAVNTTTARPATLRSPRAGETGGLSGRPLFDVALATVQRLRRLIGDEPTLIAAGGIGSVEAASAMFDAGADLLQVYTALVYRGPGLARTLTQPDYAASCEQARSG